MKKFLLGLLTGLVLAGLSLFILFFALMRLGDHKPEVPDGATLVVRLEGEVPEVAPVELPLPFFESQTPLTVTDLHDVLERAATDSRIKALVFAPRGAAAGWGKMQEIRDGLLQFRKSGKPLVAFLRTPGTREYYMATACDKIYLTTEDVLDVKGLRIEAMYLKDTLDKVGVKMEFEHAGKYKDYGDMFTRDNMSPETREVYDSLLDGLYGNLLAAVAQGRNKKLQDVSALIDQGPFLAADAKKAGLVDDLLYEDQVFEQLKSRLGQKDLRRVSQRDYLKARPTGEGGRRVAVVAADGAIVRGSGRSDFGNQEGIVSGPFIKLLREVGRDASIKGVIVRVDSPGGDSIASDDIWREMKVLAQKKPLVISMSDVAASGGYYISAVQEPIVAYPTTITGSIGVVYGKPNLRGLYDKLGIKKELMQRGANAALDSDYGPLTDQGRAKLRTIIDSTYRRFVGLVAESRKKPYEQIDAIAQGRVWLGAQAKQNGLVDELGGIDKAIEIIRRKANFSSADRVRLMLYPPHRSLFEQLMRSTTDAVVDSAAGTPEVRALARKVNMDAWTRGGLMKIMPYRIEVK
jgi:protease IV